MAGEKPYKTGAGNDDERVIVAEMILNRQSEHWNFCREYVMKQVRKRAKGMHPGDQDDIVQEVMEKVLLKLSSFRFASALGSWVNSIIHRCIIDKYRKIGTEQKYLAAMPGSDNEKDGDDLPLPDKCTEEVFEGKQYTSAYVDALLEYAEKHKPVRDKLILKLFIEDEFNQAEIAKRAGCSATTVKNVTDAAQRYAQEKMKERGWDQ